MAEQEEMIAEEENLEPAAEAEEVVADETPASEPEAEAEADVEGLPEAVASPIRTIEPPTNPNIPDLRPGDAVSVHVLIKEGDRERVQEFRGIVIRTRKGGVNASFTVRRVAAHGIGVERTFLMRSPLVERVEIQRRAHVRRAKLYYLRERTGKRARLREKR